MSSLLRMNKIQGGGGGETKINGNTKKLRERISVSYNKGTSAGNSVFSSVCLHSVELVSVHLVIMPTHSLV
jgi:hypothetical protein